MLATGAPPDLFVNWQQIQGKGKQFNRYVQLAFVPSGI